MFVFVSQSLAVMSKPERSSLASPGTVLSVIAMVLYCSGFIRTERKLHEQSSKMEAIEKRLAQVERPVKGGKQSRYLLFLFCKKF